MLTGSQLMGALVLIKLKLIKILTLCFLVTIFFLQPTYAKAPSDKIAYNDNFVVAQYIPSISKNRASWGRITPYRPNPEIESHILKVFGTQKAVNIAICESGLNHLAINDNPQTGDYSVGIFQINLYGKLRDSRPSEEWLLIPENNIAYAYQMYLKSGFTPWTSKG